jgi:hypothetical protein
MINDIVFSLQNCLQTGSKNNNKPVDCQFFMNSWWNKSILTRHRRDWKTNCEEILKKELLKKNRTFVKIRKENCDQV